MASGRRLCWVLWVALVIGLAAAARAADSPDLQIGPYLQSVMRDSAVVMWHSGASAPGRVEFGEGEALDRRAAETQPKHVHEVRLTGLKPGTRYRYRVVWGDHTSDVYSFRTAPPVGTRQFRLALYGDNRTQPEVHREIVRRVLAERPELVLNTGDLVAAGRQVEQWEPMFFGPLRPLMREIPYWPSLGNHEQNADSYYHFFSLPNNEAWYSFDYANAHVIALDSNQPYGPGSPQYQWLEEDLKNARADWKMVFFHHPMFSAHPTRGVNANRWAWEPLFLKYGVNLVLTGHDHHYQRCLPIGSADGRRVTYHFTSGGGGAPLYPVQETVWTAATQSVHHFMVFDFDGRKARGKAITVEGKQIDDFTIDLDRRPSASELVAYEPLEWQRKIEEDLRAGAPVSVRAGAFRVPVSLSLGNPMPRPIRGEIAWENASGWQIEPARVPVSLVPGGRAQVSFVASGRWPEAYPVPVAVLRLQEGAEGFRNREIRLAPIRIRPERELSALEGEAPLVPGLMIGGLGSQRLADVAIGVRRTPSGLELRARVPQPRTSVLTAGETERDAARVWNRDESLLVRLAIPGGGRYDLGANSRGTLYDARGGDAAWNGAWSAETRAADGGWEATFRIPWSDLGLSGPPAPGARWRFNLARMDGDRRETSEWVPTFGDAAAAEQWGTLRFPFGPPPNNADGPWNHRVLLATSKDGLAWTVGSQVLAERASVPELFAGPDGRPIMLFVDASGTATRGALGALAQQADGSWARRDTNLRGADPNVVRLEGGSYRAYTKDRDGAINVFSSRDGLQWDRIGVAFQDDRYPHATDADVFETSDGWVALISLGPRLLRCTSSDGLRFGAGEVMDLGGSVSDTVTVTGGWRTYFHVNAHPRTGGKMLIRSAFTADGKTWQVEDGDRVTAPATGPAHLGVADPAPLRLNDGSWLMAVKSFIEPRGGPPFNNADGPWNRDVIAYRVSRTGDVEKVATFERAGVPTIARLKDGRLIVAHQHFPENDARDFDKVAVRFSSDDGKTWSGPKVLRVEGLPEGMRFPFDPTLVPLPDGRVRLYFTGNYGRTFDRSSPAIYSAVSKDGMNYTFEPGVRFNVEGRMIIDCAVVLHREVFHLFVPDNGAPPAPGQRPGDRSREGVGYHATSKDGLAFTRVEDVQIEGRRRWLGNAGSDGRQITFYGTGQGLSASPADRPRDGFWMATSKDGMSWKLVANPPISGGDPGAVKSRDGGLLVVITGESRARGVNAGGPPPFLPRGGPFGPR